MITWNTKCSILYWEYGRCFEFYHS